jgi:hypothetical protein
VAHVCFFEKEKPAKKKERVQF